MSWLRCLVLQGYFSSLPKDVSRQTLSINVHFVNSSLYNICCLLHSSIPELAFALSHLGPPFPLSHAASRGVAVLHELAIWALPSTTSGPVLMLRRKFLLLFRPAGIVRAQLT